MYKVRVTFGKWRAQVEAEEEEEEEGEQGRGGCIGPSTWNSIPIAPWGGQRGVNGAAVVNLYTMESTCLYVAALSDHAALCQHHHRHRPQLRTKAAPMTHIPHRPKPVGSLAPSAGRERRVPRLRLGSPLLITRLGPVQNHRPIVNGV